MEDCEHFLDILLVPIIVQITDHLHQAFALIC